MIYEIWSEGYRASGDRRTAKLWGRAEGTLFVDAVDSFAQTHPEFAEYYHRPSMSWWGCRLFSTERGARALFG